MNDLDIYTDAELQRALQLRGYNVVKTVPLASRPSTLTRDELYAGNVKYMARQFCIVPLADGTHSVRASNARHEVAHCTDAQLGDFFRASFTVMQEQYDTRLLQEKLRREREAAPKPARVKQSKSDLADLLGSLDLDLSL